MKVLIVFKGESFRLILSLENWEGLSELVDQTEKIKQ